MVSWKRIFLKEKKKTTNTFLVELSKQEKRRIWRNIRKELRKRELYKRKNGWR